MKIILLQDVAKIGRKFETVEVSDGYAFNYLIPRGMAQMSTPSKEKELESKRAEELSKRASHIEEVLKKIKALKKPIVLKAKANEKGGLFAGLEKDDLLKALKEQGDIALDKNELVLEEPIKNTGDYELKVLLGEKEAQLPFSVEEKVK